MKTIWIIGAGTIAQEYAKIVNDLGYSFTVIGRGEEKAKQFTEKTRYPCITGGLEKFIATNPQKPKCAIVATNLSSLADNCKQLMQYGIRNILCEKPGFLYPSEILSVKKMADSTNTNLFYAYNRRFYASVRKAKEIIQEDGGVKSFNFEFTEWGHIIKKLNKPKASLENWFFANSTHIVDLAFHLGGYPIQMESFTSGELTWHKPAVFAGAGITDKGALFNYSANWAAPGRWGVEILTSKQRLYLRPLEQLQIQNIGSVAVNPVEIDDQIDKDFKPGFFMETKAFLEGDYFNLCSIREQADHVNVIYYKIMGK